MTSSLARRQTVRLWPERHATIGHRHLQINRLRWVTPTALAPVALHPEDIPYGPRRMRPAAAPIPLRAAVADGYTASRRNELRKSSSLYLNDQTTTSSARAD